MYILIFFFKYVINKTWPLPLIMLIDAKSCKLRLQDSCLPGGGSISLFSPVSRPVDIRGQASFSADILACQGTKRTGVINSITATQLQLLKLVLGCWHCVSWLSNMVSAAIEPILPNISCSCSLLWQVKMSAVNRSWGCNGMCPCLQQTSAIKLN